MDMSHEAVVKQRAQIIEEVRGSATDRVKVAVADIDGILRGKCIHVEKFVSAVEGGLGFDVFGYDMEDRPIANTFETGRLRGFGDTTVILDLATYRHIPWDENIPFFLGDFVKHDGSPHPLCPRQLLKKVLARAERMGFQVKVGSEHEFINVKSEPGSGWDSERPDPVPITEARVGYTLVHANAHKEYFNALWKQSAKFGIPLESLHTETGPGVYEAAIMFGDALRIADCAILFKEAAKEIGAHYGIIPSFMAKWHKKYPGCSGHVHQSLTDGERNVFHDDNGRHGGMSRVFESYLAGQIQFLMELGPMFWPTINSYKRLVKGFWAPIKPSWGIDNRSAAFRVLPGSAASARLETRFAGADMNAYLAFAAIVAAGLAGIERNLELTARPITGDNEGAEHLPTAPRTLIEATQAFRKSDLARDWFGDEFVDYYAATREWEWGRWLDAVTDWERTRYFEII